MEFVINEQSSNVVVSGQDTETVNSNTVELILEQAEQGNVLIDGANTIIVVESPKKETVLAGMVGPRGESAEDADVYSKRVDFITDSILYRGEAAVGSTEGSAVWRIRKITLGVDGDVTEIWASGNSNFDKQWTLRASYSYV